MMNVAELIEMLQETNQDAQVVFGCDYGDITHTEQVLGVNDVCELDPEEEMIVKSAYSKSGFAIQEVVEGTNAEYEPKDAEPIVVLRTR